MAKRINAKLILELLDRGMSAREIQRTRGISQQSIRRVREAAKDLGVSWDSVAKKDEQEVYDLLFPAQAQARSAIGEVDYDYVHSELQKTGVTQKLLWEEYRDNAAKDGLAYISYTSFCRGYKKYVRARNVTNHLEHKPGQVMEVDWSGSTMNLVDPFTKKTTKAYLFVATLPYSQYSYVEATLDMKQNTWLMCHVHAYDFFGGVALRCVCDNLKCGVISHPREGEIVLNEAYEALGRHYMCAIMPTGVKKPKQKPSVEGTVGKIATAIIAKLRNREFRTLYELNEAISEKVAEFNAAPFQKRDGNRKAVFDEVESAFLSPLPTAPFEICEWVYGRVVNLDFHVVFEKNRYSVPHCHVGSKADLRITATTVEIYVGSKRVASHLRLPSFIQYRYQTDPSHMPPEFVKAAWDERRILSWAKEIGPSTCAVITKIFGSVQIKEQAYNPTLAVLNLTRHYTEQELEEACTYALDKVAIPRCKFIKTVLASNTQAKADEEFCDEYLAGGYIRGEGYYAYTEEA